MARTFYKGQSPIGRRVRPGGPTVPWFTIVGVLKDVKQGGVDQKTGTEMYFLIDQTANQAQFANAPGTLNIVLRSTLPAGALRSAIEHAVREADASVPIARLQDMNGVFDESIRRPRLLAHLLGGFAGIALLLAAIGTYGILSYMVAERRREIGIRMALGADHGKVIDLVLRGAFKRVVAGLILGLPLALGAGRLIAAQLYGVTFWDPLALAVAAGSLAVCAFVAAIIPAARAASISPMKALRTE